ncbi:hypothetical protein DPX16_2894 [Anabarilius grahami]|uniref:Uncharacterized protein n=1 Tax=Anabarilius grahami TaxID=495550 RepID=A0A3N0YBN3_ANAGA|nr:hypothetical protein DPX16_2894 [Anabarilius grahami]
MLEDFDIREEELEFVAQPYLFETREASISTSYIGSEVTLLTHFVKVSEANVNVGQLGSPVSVLSGAAPEQNGQNPLQTESYAAMRQPEPEEKRTVLTLAPEVELHSESDQWCEPATSSDKGIENMDNEDWLRDFSEELSQSSSPVPCCDIEPQVELPPAASVREDPATLTQASDLFAPSRPIDLSAPPWLLPPSAPPETLCLAAPPGSLVPPAPPWPVVTLLPPRTCGPSAALCSSTHLAAAGSSFPSASPLSFVTPALPQPSDTLAAPPPLAAVASPRSPVPAMSLVSIGSLSAPMDPSASSPAVVPQLLSATTPSWLLLPSTPPWAVGTVWLWVCASGLLPPLPPGDLQNPLHPSLCFFISYGVRLRLAGGGSNITIMLSFHGLVVIMDF